MLQNEGQAATFDLGFLKNRKSILRAACYFSKLASFQDRTPSCLSTIFYEFVD